jgi:hypothetical protein
VRRAALFEIIEHHIRRTHQLLIAADVIGAPDEVARIARRHIANGCPFVASEGEDGCGSLAQRWASIVGGEWRKAPLYWASG